MDREADTNSMRKTSETAENSTNNHIDKTNEIRVNRTEDGRIGWNC